MSKQQVKDKPQAIVLTPAQEKLLEFLEPREISDLVKCLKRVFELACFFSMIDLQNNDITSLYLQFELIELLTEIEKEQYAQE